MEGDSNQKAMNVQVAVRCRPTNTEERTNNHPTVVQCDSDARQVKVNYGPLSKKISKTFSFDKVFGMYSTQQEVFDSVVRPIVDETLEGFNCTIFAYGQTGTGKTHTMEGNISSEEDAGIVPRSVRAILEKLEASGAEFTIRVSFLELYNEELQDLLAEGVPSDDKNRLRLCEDIKKGGVVCQNLEEITVLNATDILNILQKGIKQRQTAETLCNKNSSRSHSIFTMKIMIKETNVDGEEVIRNGQLNLVDLAGSECVGRSGAKNARAREAGSINQSLLTLGRVITALVDHHGHVPYRDSKLTRLLQESLGGRAKTCIIATFSPSQLAVEETLSTLDYAHRAKSIKNIPQVNQRMTKKVVLKEYCAEIESLKAMLQITREKNGVYVDPAHFANMEARLASQESQLLECESALKVRSDEVKSLRLEKEELSDSLLTAKAELDETSQQLSTTQETLQHTEKELETTKVELVATGAVVAEQVVTENDLHEHVTELQGDLTSRRNEIDGLFVKIDKFADKEIERINNVKSFVSEIDNECKQTHSSIHNMSAKTITESENLCNGVVKMLSKGNDICSELKASIAIALKVLIDDSEIAKTSMTDTCTSVQGQLSSSKKDVIDTLSTLQLSLSDWLGEVETSMNNAQTGLIKQQEELHDFDIEVSNHFERITSVSKTFKDSQQSLSIQATKQFEELQNQLDKRTAEFEEFTFVQSKENEAKFEEKTMEMEKTLQTMLQDFRTSYSKSSASTLSSTKSFLSDVSTTAKRGYETIQTTITEMDENTNKTFDSIQSISNDNKTTCKISIKNVSTGLKAVEECVTDVSSSVGNKRQILDTNINNLTESFQKSVDNMASEVQTTSDVACTMFNDIKIASNKMDDSVSTSVNTFKEFLDTQGATLSTEIDGHFDVLNEFLTTQSTSIETISNNSKTFAENIESSQLQSSGQTPKKIKFSALKDITSTRDHKIIKEESRNNQLNKRTVDSSADGNDTIAIQSPSKKISFGTKNSENIENFNNNLCATEPVLKASLVEDENCLATKRSKTRLKKQVSNNSLSSDDSRVAI